MPDVILLGDINIDVTAAIPAYPARGTEGVATAVEYHTGGSVVSTAVALANMKVNNGIIGRVGTDALAAQAIADLEKMGVGKTLLQIDEVVSTGLIYIVVNPDGERTMFSSRGANVFTRPDEAWEAYFSKARWYHFSGYALLAQPQQDAALHGLELARRNRCKVSLDPNPEPAMTYTKGVRDILPQIDLFLPNEQELIVMAGGKSFQDAVRDMLDAGTKSVVVKRGAKGCVVANEKEYLEIPGFKIQVRNTTGAGDSFNAGVVMGRMVGLSWAASGILGNALGALASISTGISASEINASKVIELIEKDMFEPQWRDWQWALEQLLAYLAAF